MEYYGNGDGLEISIRYSVTPVEFGTGDRLLAAREVLKDTFLLLYCDNYCPIDFDRLSSEFREKSADIQLSAYSNKDNYTRNNLFVDDNGTILTYDKTRQSDNLNCVDIGYAIIKKTTLNIIKDCSTPINFEKEVYPVHVAQKSIYATVTEHRYYSIGSWDRIELTKEFFSDNKTVFLDRDGTINVRPPKACYVEKPEDFIWLDGAKKAIGKLKDKGYRVILLSNQPGIARGNLSDEMLSKIHQKMQKELKEETGYEIDDIFYCPHNWDEGCDCRKPNRVCFIRRRKSTL